MKGVLSFEDAAKMVNCILGCTEYSTNSWSKEVILLLCSVLVWPHLKYGVHLWAAQCRGC